MKPSVNPLIMLVDIFRSPSDCFAALYQRGMWGWQNLHCTHDHAIPVLGRVL